MDDGKIAWIERVLGFRIFGPEPPALPDHQRVLQTWLDAVAAVDRDFDALASGFRATGNASAAKLADQGLPRLRQLLVEKAAASLAALPPDANAQGRATSLAALAELDGNLASLPDIGLLERNPLGISIQLRSVLQQASETIRRYLRDAIPGGPN